VLRQLVEIGVLGQLVIGFTAAAISYILASILLRVTELQQLLNYGRMRIANRKG
jgi:hypothetical protein